MVSRGRRHAAQPARGRLNIALISANGIAWFAKPNVPLLRISLRRAQELAVGGARERRADADAAHADVLERRQRQRLPGEAHDRVHRLRRHRLARRRRCRRATSARARTARRRRRRQTPRSRRIVSFEIGDAVQKVLGARRQRERKRQGACRCDGRAHALERRGRTDRSAPRRSRSRPRSTRRRAPCRPRARIVPHTPAGRRRSRSRGRR